MTGCEGTGENGANGKSFRELFCVLRGLWRYEVRGDDHGSLKILFGATLFLNGRKQIIVCGLIKFFALRILPWPKQDSDFQHWAIWTQYLPQTAKIYLAKRQFHSSASKVFEFFAGASCGDCSGGLDEPGIQIGCVSQTILLC